VLLLCLAACTSPPSQPTGSVQFAASTQQALSASDITRVKVTVSAVDMSSLVVDMAQTNGSWGGLIGNIPAGSNRSFLAEAFDASGTLRFQGQTPGVTIPANQTTAVAITLQQTPPPTPYGNEAPIIESLVASSTSIQTGGSLSLTATVRDPNTGDTLSLAWTASGGTFSAPSSATTTWTAPPCISLQTLTLTVRDSQGTAVSVSLAINVVTGAATNADLNFVFNLWPVVSSVSASLNRLDAGQSTTISALVSDGDGDTLSYQWAASCAGTWSNATSSTATFRPSAIPAGACNNCRLTVTVQDARGGQTTGFLNLCVATSTTERFPPAFSNFHQSASSISPGQAVSFDVTAADPQASTLSFAWTATTGTLATAQTTATTSQVVWTAPSCAVTNVTPTVTATVTNAHGLSASRPFSLSGLPACVAGWSAAGSLSAGRHIHTATLLSSGKVLVTGGRGASNSLASAEMYTPATSSWSSAGSMAIARDNHTATLLPSGKVLVVGGYNNGSFLASTEVYDPATHSWSSAGTMAAARGEHTATLLNSGKVLVVGGYNGSVLTSAELYDPATNSWSPAGFLTTRRAAHIATLLPSGKVLVAGGAIASSVGTASAELYDPATNSWSSAGTMAAARFHFTATRLNSGKVLVTGGYGIPASAEVYDPATNSWASVAPILLARFQPISILLPSGKVLVTGGYNGTSHAEAELYDPVTNSWSVIASMATGRTIHTATLLSSGQVLVVGGYNASGGLPTPTELYTP
jgi:N-acetylneuraminic acid mutarotase